MRLRTLVKSIKLLFAPPPPPVPRKTRAQIEEALRAKATAEGRPEPDVKSVVDVCKLFDLDASIEGRKDLRGQLGLSTEDYTGTAEQNVELMDAIYAALAKGEIWDAQEA